MSICILLCFISEINISEIKFIKMSFSLKMFFNVSNQTSKLISQPMSHVLQQFRQQRAALRAGRSRWACLVGRGERTWGKLGGEGMTRILVWRRVKNW